MCRPSGAKGECWNRYSRGGTPGWIIDAFQARPPHGVNHRCLPGRDSSRAGLLTPPRQRLLAGWIIDAFQAGAFSAWRSGGPSRWRRSNPARQSSSPRRCCARGQSKLLPSQRRGTPPTLPGVTGNLSVPETLQSSWSGLARRSRHVPPRAPALSRNSCI